MMTTYRTARRPLLAASALAATAALITLAPALPASAHNYVVATTPGEGETVTAVPETFTITTNETLLDIAGDASGFALQVSDEAGQFFGDGCLTVDGASMSMPATLGDAGTYTVAYQFVSADSHSLSGEYTFVYEPAADATITPGSAEPLACGDPLPGAANPAPSEVPDASGEPSANDEPAVSDEPTPAPSESADATDAAGDATGLPVAATVGIAAGALALLAAIIGGVVLARRRRA